MICQLANKSANDFAINSVL